MRKKGNFEHIGLEKWVFKRKRRNYERKESRKVGKKK